MECAVRGPGVAEPRSIPARAGAGAAPRIPVVLSLHARARQQRRARHGVTVDPAVEFVPYRLAVDVHREGEPDLFAPQPRIRDLRGAPPDADCAGNRLVLLLQLQL